MIAREVIESLELERHPEGGWFRRTFESSSKISTPHGERAQGSCIYYLLAGNEYSLASFEERRDLVLSRRLWSTGTYVWS